MTTTTNDIAQDMVYVGHDRVWVYTYELSPRLCMTIFYGPGLGDEGKPPRAYGSREEAVAGHEAALAEFGYRKTGLRKYKWFRWLEHTAKGLVNVSRRPLSRKSVWIMAAFWAFALLCAVVSVFTQNWWSIPILAFDGFMLYQCILGLLWSYNIPRS